MITAKDHLQELNEAAEAVIDIAMHPNRPDSLKPRDLLRINRLRTALARLTSEPHTPAPWAPSVSKDGVQDQSH